MGNNYARDYQSYILLGISAVCYASAFVYYQWLWWLVFVYSIPLLYAACRFTIHTWHGFFWGLLFFTTQGAGLAASLYHMAYGPWYLCVLPGLFFIVYMSLYPMVLFGLLSYAARLVDNTLIATLILWVGGLCVLTSIIERYALMPLGSLQGYSFINPLLPLTYHPQLLRLVPYIGTELTVVLLLTVAAMLTACIISWSYVKISGLVLISLFWILLLSVSPQPSLAPSWVSRVAILPVTYPICSDGRVAAQSFIRDICCVVQRHPSINIIIVPESALPHALISHLDACVWPSLCAHVQFIVGSNMRIGTHYCNCALWLMPSRQKAWFAKRRLLPPVEQVPSICSALQKLYNTGQEILEPSDNNRMIFALDEACALVPYICSELFLSVQPDDTFTHVPIVALVNDSWCVYEYLAQCMYLCARFKAIVWQRDILYASFQHAAWFSKTGDIIPLIRA